MKLSELKINGIENPRGFSYDKLLCSWKVSDTKAKKQVRACIEVSLTPDFTEIIYKKEGKELTSNETMLDLVLKPRTDYYWRVSVTGDNGEAAVSGTAVFETGKMEEPWRARWIGTSREDTFHPVLKKKFALKRMPVRARFYVCGLGLYEAYVNGKKLGQDYLAPFLNDYQECFQYQTYDAAGLLDEENELEIFLGKGWYMGAFGLQNQPNLFGNEMMAIGELHLEYEDGSSEMVCTDESWFYQGSDIEESGIYFGEIFNRLLWSGKENPLKHVEVKQAPGRITERYSLPVTVKEELIPVKILSTPAGETVLDLGQNQAGYMEFTAAFPSGTRIVLECGEILQKGNFYHDNYRDAQSVFIYVSDGRKELVRPHFTYFGYRYLKVTGWPGKLRENDIRAKVVYSDLERTGYIETSHEKINRLYNNSLWSQKSNFIDLPTDCPQRDERLGWTGDAQVFAATASYHMDTRAFYRKYLRDLRSEQLRAGGAVPNYIPSFGKKGGAANVWGDAATFIPARLFFTYGGLEEMKGYYPLMRGWTDFLYDRDVRNGGKRLLLGGFQFGDWLALDGITEESFKGGTDDGYIGSVYYYQSAKLTSEMAGYLRLAEDEAYYRNLSEEIRRAIWHEYFTPSGRLALDTQTSYVIALKFGICPDRQKLISQFRERLKKDCYQIKCGFVGAPLLCTVLCENGMADLAYDFLFQEGYPGWLYCVNLGATTIWERWNSLLEDGTCSGTGMNSFNHYAYGAVAEFLYACAGGIRLKEPGYRKAYIEPLPDGRFHYFSCTYHSVCGTYVSDWKIEEDGKFCLHVEIPFNCEAEVVLPRCNGQARFALDSGSYDFAYIPSRDFRMCYDENTRLAQLQEDEEALEILKNDLPEAYEIIMSKDKENLNLSLGELESMFFLGFTPEKVAGAAKKIYSLKRW